MKKLFYGLAAVAAVATPVIAVVSCGNKTEAAKTAPSKDLPGAGKAAVVIPHIPAFDGYLDATVEAFKTTAKNAFHGLVKADGTAIDVASFDPLKTIEAINAKFAELNVNLKTTGTSESVTVTPHALPSKDAYSAKALTDFKAALVAKFAGKFQSRTLIDTSSITGATVEAIKTAATALSAKNMDGTAHTITLPADPVAPAASKTVEQYKTELIALFAGKYATYTAGTTTPATHTDVSTASLDSAANTTDAKAAAKTLATGIFNNDGTPATIAIPEPTIAGTDETPEELATYITDLKTLFTGKYATYTAGTTTQPTHTDVSTATITAATDYATAHQAAVTLSAHVFDTNGNAVTITVPDVPATPTVTTAQIDAFKQSVKDLFANTYSSVTPVNVDAINGATTVEAAYNEAVKLLVDKTSAHGDNLAGTVVTLDHKPAFDDYLPATVTAYLQTLVHQFDHLVSAQGSQTAIVTTTITGTPEAALAAAQALASAGTFTSAVSEAHNASPIIAPAKDVYTQTAIDAYKTAVVKAFTDKGVADTELATIKAATTVDAIEKAAIAVHPANGDSVSEAKASLEDLYKSA